jgi:REP element-mobilizing transposase RayT
MARVARRDAPGAIHHVLLRGIERRWIFLDDRDRGDFLDRLARQIAEGRGSCFAWALMPNHVHLLLRTGERPLSEAMRRLNTGYARAFNLRHRRTGYLFQDRFRSILVEDDGYLRVVLRYIHLNPVRGKLVPSLDALARHPWAGHSRLMGFQRAGFQAVDQVLGWFSPEPRAARRALWHWMEGGLCDPGDRDALRPATPRSMPSPGVENGSSIHGAATALAEATPPEIRARERRRQGWTLELLAAWACAEMKADLAEVRSGGRGRLESRARSVIGHLATRELGSTLLEASAFTGVTAGPMSRSVRRGESIANRLRIALPAAPPESQARPSPHLA